MHARSPPNWTAAVAALALAAAPFATKAGPITRPGEENRGFDLGLFGPNTPDILQKAKADPYAPPAEPACEHLPQELTLLDEVLGPDVDVPKPKRGGLRQRIQGQIQPTKWLGQAARSAIPHRDVVRFVTGADRKQKALNDAAMAGMARRGYLKGLARTLACAPAEVKAALKDPKAAPPAVEHPPASAIQTHAPVKIANIAPSATASAVPAVALEPVQAKWSPTFIATPVLASAPLGDGAIAR